MGAWEELDEDDHGMDFEPQEDDITHPQNAIDQTTSGLTFSAHVMEGKEYLYDVEAYKIISTALQS